MAEHNADIVIYGAGIAGLWTLAHLRHLGYNAILLEKTAIGGIQTIASQGIIHSGLKYIFSGKMNDLARTISTMPDIWRDALKGEGSVDLSAAKVSAESQNLLIPKSIASGLVKVVAQKTLGESAKETDRADWPSHIVQSGFSGSMIFMSEPVLDIPSVIRALAEPNKNFIRKSGEPIDARAYIHTSAGGNHGIEIETQIRPLLMGLMKNAPFPLFAHFVGMSDKPVATITTHTSNDGSLVWYVGGLVAERSKDSNPNDVYNAIKSAFAKYMPSVNLSGIEWATLGVDRIEGKSKAHGFLPNTPTLHKSGKDYYAWPTKLTFAPLLSSMIAEQLKEDGILPSGTQKDWSFLPEVPYAEPPWNIAQWTKENSGARD